MNRTTSATLLALTTGLAPCPRPAAVQVGGRQWFDKTRHWSPNDVFLYTTYYFRSKPGVAVQTQRVVWYSKSEKHRRYFYHFNQDTGAIRCRAKAFDCDYTKLRQVLDDNEIKTRIGDIADGVWDSHDSIRPTIPAATTTYHLNGASYVAAGRSLARRHLRSPGGAHRRMPMDPCGDS